MKHEYPGEYRFKTVGRYFAYHGTTLATLDAGGMGERKAKFEPFSGDFVHVAPVLLSLPVRPELSELRSRLRQEHREHDSRRGTRDDRRGDHRADHERSASRCRPTNTCPRSKACAANTASFCMSVDLRSTLLSTKDSDIAGRRSFFVRF
jgi:hypothetical protein